MKVADDVSVGLDGSGGGVEQTAGPDALAEAGEDESTVGGWFEEVAVICFVPHVEVFDHHRNEKVDEENATSPAVFGERGVDWN